MLSMIIFIYPKLLPQNTLKFYRKEWRSVLRTIRETRENGIVTKKVEYTETFGYGPFLYLELRYYAENSFSARPYEKKFETAEFCKNDIDVIINAGIELFETYGPFDLLLPKQGWIIKVESAENLEIELNKRIRTVGLI